MKNLTMLVLKGYIRLGLWARKSTKCCNQSLMGHSSWSLEDSDVVSVLTAMQTLET